MINKTDKSHWERLRQEHPPIDFNARAVDFDVDEPDAVNNPDHYASGGIECIDAIEESMASYAFHGYLKGNCQNNVYFDQHVQ